MKEPKVGDVVSLPSHPDFKMTVTGYDPQTKMYGVLWLTGDGSPHGCNLSPLALVVEDLEAEKTMEAAQAALAASHQAASMIADLQLKLGDSERARRQLGEQIAKANEVLATSLPREVWDMENTAQMAYELAQRAETFRREANEQLDALSQRVRELGG